MKYGAASAGSSTASSVGLPGTRGRKRTAWYWWRKSGGSPGGAVQDQERFIVEEQESPLSALEVADVRFEPAGEFHQRVTVGGRVGGGQARPDPGSASSSP
ncbi:hypothetical protein [Streptomyces erythrochromogenes]|uniref:hypothetical protein n=1 Tax=Streptomyces erythrochromogenes TaxID=285574 RepID=UPI003689035F